MTTRFALLLILPFLAQAQTQQTTVLRCGKLIDSISSAISLNKTVVVRNGMIVDVGGNITPPANAEVVDLSNFTCLPGLIDTHVHVLWDPRMNVDAQILNRSSARKALDGLKNARVMLDSGFTTIRVPGETDRYYATVDLRDAIKRGDFIGPRILVAPHFLTATGGHADLNDLAPDMLTTASGRIVSGADSARQTVREEVKYGADWIKIHVTGGVLSAKDDPRVTAFTDDEIRAIVDEAHRYKKLVCVHAHATEGIKTAIRAGVDSVEHGTLIDKEGIELMLKHGTYLVPTVFVLNYIIEQGEKANLPPSAIAKGRSIVEERNRNLRAAFAAGVKLAYGSDTVFPHHLANREFAALIELGVTPMEAVRMATVNAATMLRINDEVGTIEIGKRADIVAAPENPLEKPHALENVRFVMKDGRVIRSDLK